MRIKILVLGFVCLFLIGCASLSTWLSEQDTPPITAWNKAKKDYLETHPEISSEMRVAIEQGDVLLGMTSAQVVACRGKPQKINKTTGSYGVHERWVMVIRWHSHTGLTIPKGLVKKAKKYAYVYFENGIVTSWESR